MPVCSEAYMNKSANCSPSSKDCKTPQMSIHRARGTHAYATTALLWSTIQRLKRSQPINTEWASRHGVTCRKMYTGCYQLCFIKRCWYEHSHAWDVQRPSAEGYAPIASCQLAGRGWRGWLVFTGGALHSSDGSPWCPRRTKSSLATSRPPTKASPWCWTPPEMET